MCGIAGIFQRQRSLISVAYAFKPIKHKHIIGIGVQIDGDSFRRFTISPDKKNDNYLLNFEQKTKYLGRNTERKYFFSDPGKYSGLFFYNESKMQDKLHMKIRERKLLNKILFELEIAMKAIQSINS